MRLVGHALPIGLQPQVAADDGDHLAERAVGDNAVDVVVFQPPRR